MRPIIKVQHLAKQYQVGEQDAAYQTLRDTIASAVTTRLRRPEHQRRGEAKPIWALRDISFEVQRGEVLGVIGHNGAGKSTLLKILSRVTSPTSGKVELYGRLGSLLEVGTGFHPELTGRENVFLSGTILGMQREEIRRKFDEIVAFSEVERFLDTPVKRYSSGMYVRLAFSVAAHLEPEILLVDEVLAVGDQSFQRKCLERMKRLKTSGTTILLVSHNMAAIQSTCERSVLLDCGSIAGIGATSDVLKIYRDLVQKSDKARKSTREASPEDGSSGTVRILGFEMRDKTGQPRSSFHFGEEVSIRIKLHAAERIYSPLINFGIKRGDGVIVCNFNNWYDNFKIDYIEGDCTLEGWLPPLRLIPHYYEIHLLVWQRFKGAAEEGLSGLRPLCSILFGNFSIDGPPMTDQDGVFQQPAAKWVLTREGERIESPAIDDHSLFDAFSDGPQSHI